MSVRAKGGRKHFCALSRPTCKTHPRGSNLADGCKTALSHTPQKIKCVYVASLFNVVLILLTLKNNGWGTITPSVLWVPVRLNIHKSLIVLENALRFDYKCTLFSLSMNEYSSPLSTKGGGNILHCLSPVLKWRRPLVSPPDARYPDSYKTVMCSSDGKWERGQVNHRVMEIKDDGQTAV